MILEIVTTTLEETLIAQNALADRVELVSGITEGALTPTYGSLVGVHGHSKMPAFCMIRPHNHGFVYSDHDIEEMIEDIKNQVDIADAIVLGCLNQDGTIDEVNLAKLLSVTKDVPVVFHKAFDNTPDVKDAIDTLSKFPKIKRILTSFQQTDIPGNLDFIKKMFDYATSKGFAITFAGGVKLETIPYLKSIGITDVHISSAARIDTKAANLLDPERILAFRQACDK